MHCLNLDVRSPAWKLCMVVLLMSFRAAAFPATADFVATEKNAPQTPKPAPFPAGPIPVPRPANKPVLKYPAESRANNEEGKVVLNVRMDQAGKVQSVSVAKSSGYLQLDEAALRYGNSMVFDSIVENGDQFIAQVKIMIEFKIDKNEQQ